jgi:hypothetical protein
LNIISRWYGSGQGLRLEIIDATDYPYQLYITKSVEDWQASQALNLTLTDVPHEVLCKPQVGRIKVCNGDYGDTDWRGMMLLFLEGEHIVASSIRMNDYHILNSISVKDIAYDQYNVCHQLGHAFGLPHSQGTNCMASAEFTDILFSDLQHPDSSTLENLVELYGEQSRKLESSTTGLRGSHRQEEDDGRILELGDGIRVKIHKF